MHLAIVIVLLLAWAGYGIYQKSKPSAPPIKDLDEHTKTLMSMNSQKERRKYLDQVARQNIKKDEENSNECNGN